MTDETLAAALRDRYVLEREIGHGGMATVYLARDLKHKRPVALKVLRPELAQSLGPERFWREIELAARLQHPHILTVHDSGEAAGQLWFTMPFVEGESLRDRLSRQKQLPIEDAVQIAKEAAQALQYAHQHGVIHRDIKPENILLTSDGSTLVADFGLARALRGGDERLTATGLAVGTPAYMSPEQASGERDLGVTTDIYSLGCVLYEMLAGEPPFPGPTAQVILARRLSGETPRVRMLRPAVPESLERAVTRALAPVAADRFASAADFVRALPTPGVSSGSDRMVGAPAAAIRPARRPLATGVVAALALLAVGGAGLLWQHRRGSGDAGTAGPTRLAVLPFENLGDSADAYFADGVADEVRGKLTGLPGLEVIARASSVQYRQSPRPPQQIAHELGVRYLLTGTVRWDKRDGSRVRVSPELIDAGSGRAPASAWQQPFEAALTDVFQVQADIATRVAQALGLALGDSTRRQLVQRPTANLAAYDAFLKGEAITADFVAADPTDWPRAIKHYEQAVALDPGFVAAWVQLSRARAWQYSYLTPLRALADGALEAAERARALAPGRPEPYLALGEYYSLVRLENGRSLDALEVGLRMAPNNVALLTTAGRTEARLGRWEATLARLDRAGKLDPRSAVNWRRYGLALLLMRRYDQARVALDRALALVPTNPDVLGLQATLALAQGDTARARAIVSKPPAGVDPTELAVWSARINDLYWVLDDETQRRVLAQPPSAYANDRSSWAIVRAQIHYARGELSQARVWADTARLEFEQGVQGAPDKAEVHVFLGLALAYLGRKRDAIAEGERALALAPISQDAFIGPYIQHQLVRIYIVMGEQEKALDRLEPLLRLPYTLSPAWLRIDPNFAPLRGTPRFEHLLAASGLGLRE